MAQTVGKIRAALPADPRLKRVFLDSLVVRSSAISGKIFRGDETSDNYNEIFTATDLRRTRGITLAKILTRN